MADNWERPRSPSMDTYDSKSCFRSVVTCDSKSCSSPPYVDTCNFISGLQSNDTGKRLLIKSDRVTTTGEEDVSRQLRDISSNRVTTHGDASKQSRDMLSGRVTQDVSRQLRDEDVSRQSRDIPSNRVTTLKDVSRQSRDMLPDRVTQDVSRQSRDIPSSSVTTHEDVSRPSGDMPLGRVTHDVSKQLRDEDVSRQLKDISSSRVTTHEDIVSRQSKDISSSRVTTHEDVSKQLRGEDVSRQSKDIPSSKVTTHEGVSRHSSDMPLGRVTQDVSRQFREEDVSRQSKDIPSSRVTTHEDVSRQSKDMPLGRVTQEDVSRQSRNIPSSRVTTHEDVSRQSRDMPSDRVTRDVSKQLRDMPSGRVTHEDVSRQLIDMPSRKITTHEDVLRQLRDTPPANYILKIDSYSQFVQTRYTSQQFDAAGYKWKLNLHPNGDEERNGKGYISMFLTIEDTKSLPLGWEINAVYKFFVLDQIRNKYLSIQDACGRSVRFDAGKTEWGISQLLPYKDFHNTEKGFLIRDKCFFGAEISANRCTHEKISPVKNFEPYTYKWEIAPFSSNTKETYYSDTFMVGNLKGKLSYFPKGHNGGKDNGLSIYLQAVDLKASDRVYAKFKLCIHVHDQCSSKESEEWFEVSCTDMVLSKFSSLTEEELYDPSKGSPAVNNNKVIFEVQITNMFIQTSHF